MKLTKEILSQRGKLQSLGYQLPAYDVAKTCEQTLEAPAWVHFGAGNILRSFLAQVAQGHLDAGRMEKGIVAVEGFDLELVDKIYIPHDCLSLNAVLMADGSVQKSLIASICGAYQADPGKAEAWAWLKRVFASESLQMVSFTITEKGYSVMDSTGTYWPPVTQDFERGPGNVETYIGKVVALLYERWQKGALPVAMVSMDNCSRNGERLQQAVLAYAQAWRQNGHVEEGFVQYLRNPEKVSFPYTMIDKITPRPDDKILALFKKDGFEGIESIITARHTYAAPFVNAEKPQYLAIENHFPAGCPLPAGDGVYFTDREHVILCETMKVTTCLNPLHTALALMGCLLGFTLIADEMRDADLKAMVERLGYQEGLPVVVNPEIIEPKAFLQEVLTQRLPNPYMPDSPQRIASDTSQKMSIRFGETIKAYVKAGKDIGELQVIPMVQAAWLRYLLAVDDEGKPFELSPDPLAEPVRAKLADVVWNQPKNYHEILQPVLSDEALFGVNLYKAGMGERVEGFFTNMLQGPGAVRTVLHAVCGKV